MQSYTDLEKQLNIEIKNKDILIEALTHSSYANEHDCPCNERLEYLGDAVLELLMSKYLFENLDIPEGEMTKRRAQAVREEALVIYAKHIKLANYLYLGHGEILQQGRERPAIIADAFEAVLGAVFEDAGYNAAQKFFKKVILPHIDEVLGIKDYKSQFQELVQADKRSLSYKLVSETGPKHMKTFVMAVYMDDLLMGTGSGKTKKAAQQAAAKIALSKLA